MNIKETYELLKTTPVRTDAISLFDYISKNEEYKEFAFDMIYRYGIMVGKREERSRRKKAGVVNG